MTSGFERSQESVFLFRTLFECRKALYALAKVLETFDEPIFAAGHIVSGHTLKHLAANDCAKTEYQSYYRGEIH